MHALAWFLLASRFPSLAIPIDSGTYTDKAPACPCLGRLITCRVESEAMRKAKILIGSYWNSLPRISGVSCPSLCSFRRRVVLGVQDRVLPARVHVRRAFLPSGRKGLGGERDFSVCQARTKYILYPRNSCEGVFFCLFYFCFCVCFLEAREKFYSVLTGRATST